MNTATLNWIIAAAVLLLIIIGFFGLRPAGEAPTPPAAATAEQPAQPALAN